MPNSPLFWGTTIVDSKRNKRRIIQAEAFVHSRQSFPSRFGIDHRSEDFLLLGVERKDIDESLDSPLVQSLTGRTLLIDCLKEQGIFAENPVYEYGKYGKPILANYPGWFFNISHCKDAVVCVLAAREVGVDVESLTSPDMELMQSVLHDTEIAGVLRSPEPDRAFTRLWTRKESLLKCLGTGISDHLKYILHQHTCEFFDLSGKNYEISLCLM